MLQIEKVVQCDRWKQVPDMVLCESNELRQIVEIAHHITGPTILTKVDD